MSIKISIETKDKNLIDFFYTVHSFRRHPFIDVNKIRMWGEVVGKKGTQAAIEMPGKKFLGLGNKEDKLPKLLNRKLTDQEEGDPSGKKLKRLQELDFRIGNVIFIKSAGFTGGVEKHLIAKVNR